MHAAEHGEHPDLPLGERADLWPAAVLSPEQLFEHSGIGARHVENLHPASRPCHQRDRATADSERRSHRGQRSRDRLAVHGSFTDPDHQGPIVLPADAGTGRPRPDLNNNTHGTSVRPARLRLPPAARHCHHRTRPAHIRDEAYRLSGLRACAHASGAHAGLPPCTGSGNPVRVCVDRLWCLEAPRLQKPNSAQLPCPTL